VFNFTFLSWQVLVSSKKYAWWAWMVSLAFALADVLLYSETCIKGHRSSACKHTDRPLFEIKKKGRPVTQCEHCRELRKTKQVHVKCLCESKEDGTGPKSADTSGKRKKCVFNFTSYLQLAVNPLGFPFFSGTNKVPQSATFPNGLPGALESSVAVQWSSDGSSDSDHSGMQCHLPSIDA
jgi:hypothetical protein